MTIGTFDPRIVSHHPHIRYASGRLRSSTPTATFKQPPPASILPLLPTPSKVGRMLNLLVPVRNMLV